MGSTQLQQFIQAARIYAYFVLALGNGIMIALWWVMAVVFEQPAGLTFAVIAFVNLLLPIVFIWIVSDLFLRPLRFVWQAIMYIAPDTQGVPAPDTKHIRYGKELVTNLVTHVYQLADASHQFSKVADQDAPKRNFVAENLPLPLMVLDKDETVKFANHTMLTYVGKKAEDVVGKSVYSSLNLSFMSDNTLDSWLTTAKEKQVTSTEFWERVKLNLPDEDKPEAKLLDLATYYNKDNPDGFETMLVLFDHTKTYGRDDQAINFVALAVHELRTPLTMLRGYIEVFEEDLEGKLTPELNKYMERMRASAQQLSTFVNNILNVARVDDDQMILKLEEGDWAAFLTKSTAELSLRAKVHGIELKTTIAEGLPTVGIDRISMYEVLSNLIDNAIKYSNGSTQIIIDTTLAKNGLIETTVQDFGRGIPGSAIPHLFEKFYRDHHNRLHTGGTGMGLFLCKTLIGAHGGNIWVRSKEGQGSTFGFTLVPYAQLADKQKNQDNNGIVRNAHGWIKNHSMYRR